jgi:hypothetical protein
MKYYTLFLSFFLTSILSYYNDDDFEIYFESIDNPMKVTCLKGCDWEELSIDYRPYQPKYIDKYGIVSFDEVSNNNSPYLFSMTKTKKGVELESVRGTFWTKLSFNIKPYKKTRLDKSGVSAKLK